MTQLRPYRIAGIINTTALTSQQLQTLQKTLLWTGATTIISRSPLHLPGLRVLQQDPHPHDAEFLIAFTSSKHPDNPATWHRVNEFRLAQRFVAVVGRKGNIQSYNMPSLPIITAATPLPSNIEDPTPPTSHIPPGLHTPSALVASLPNTEVSAPALEAFDYLIDHLLIQVVHSTNPGLHIPPHLAQVPDLAEPAITIALHHPAHHQQLDWVYQHKPLIIVADDGEMLWLPAEDTPPPDAPATTDAITSTSILSDDALRRRRRRRRR